MIGENANNLHVLHRGNSMHLTRAPTGQRAAMRCSVSSSRVRYSIWY